MLHTEPFPLLRPLDPDQLWRDGLEHTRAALRCFGLLAWWVLRRAAQTARRWAGIAWAWSCERAADGTQRLMEGRALARQLALDGRAYTPVLRARAQVALAVMRAQVLADWAGVRDSRYGIWFSYQVAAALDILLPWISRVWVHVNQGRRAWLRRVVRAWDELRVWLALVLSWNVPALPAGGAVGVPSTSPRPNTLHRPLNWRKIARQRRQRWLVWMLAVDAVLVILAVGLVVWFNTIGRAGQIPSVLRPLRLDVAAPVLNLPRSRPLDLTRPDRLLATVGAPPLVAPAPRALVVTAPPVLATATAIPVDYAVWQLVLPAAPGYFGPGACSLGAAYGPIGDGSFSWPADRHFLSGYNYNVYRHPGLDIWAELSDPIYAVNSGIVVYQGWNNYGYGNFIVLDHGNGWFSAYAHLSQAFVACQSIVREGQIIGASGSTGNSTGPHLHFELFRSGEGQVSPWGVLP
jgi:murein DD-endopeptidase MepM/ murein hydrolase activator NlpD